MRHYSAMTSPLPQPTLHGDRYLLRPFAPADVEMLMQASQDDYIPRITTLSAGGGRAAADDYLTRQLERTASGGGYSFALARSDTGVAIGQVGVWLEDYEEHRVGLRAADDRAGPTLRRAVEHRLKPHCRAGGV